MMILLAIAKPFMIGWGLIPKSIRKWIVIIIAAILFILTFGKLKVRQGAKEAVGRMERKDQAHADEIKAKVTKARKRAGADERPINERLRELDGFRPGDEE